MTATKEAVLDRQALQRSRVIGILFIVIGAAIYLLFATTSDPGQTAAFGLNPGRQTAALPIPELVLPVLPSLYAMSLVAVCLGVWQLAKGFGRAEGAMLGLVALFLTVSFLAWAARGKGLNLVGILETTLQRATPIALAALSGMLCERSGIVNIAIEGMMLTAALVSALVGSISGSLWVGLIAALIASGLLGALLAVLSIRFKVNQVIAGTAINILATGITSYFSSRYLQKYAALNSPPTFSPIPLPGLSRIPVIGPALFDHTFLVYLTFILVIVIQLMLFYTRWGLRTRAVGEHPRAADTLGVNVFRTRYVNVLLGGCIAGLGGAYLVLSSVARFDELMTAGKGYIGLAAMIFGKWNPVGALGSSLIFGFADSLQTRLAILSVPIPSQFLLMAPYLVTMVVLAGVVGQSRAPAADGEPYEKE